jgi:hypothetical protein
VVNDADEASAVQGDARRGGPAAGRMGGRR